MTPKDRQLKFPVSLLKKGTLPLRRTLVVLLAGSLFLPSLQLAAIAQVMDRPTVKPVQGQVSISREVAISPSVEKVSMNFRDANIRDLLNMLAQQGKFNLILDESVTGTMTVDIKDIPINKALEYIFTVGELSYTKDGNTVIVAAQETANQRNMTAKTFKAIPVQYRSAANIAVQLSNTILKVQRPGGSTSALVSFDQDSNSLLVLGTDSDIRLIGDALRELDIPHNRKVYHIKHATPNYVAQVLAANFFTSNNNAAGGAGGAAGGLGGAAGGAAGGGAGGAAGGLGGGAGGLGGGAGGAGGAAGGAAGGGAGGAGGVAGGAAGGGAGGAAGGAAGGGAGGATGLSTFNVGGVTFIAEPISATLTVLGTDEQLALIDSIIDQVDVRRPQVAIEVSLVEIQDSTLKALVPAWGAFNFGRIGRLQTFGGGTSVNVLDLVNPFAKPKFQLPRPETFTSGTSLSFQNQNLRGKILANPTIVTMDNTTANISITDQVPTISQSNTIVNGTQTITTTITTQDAGVTLDLTPQIFNDGSVVLNLQPNVSQPVRTVSAVSGSGASATTSSTVLLATRSMNLSGVRVKDGETLVIGGLLRETAQTDISKIPGLDKLPIVSAMFRSTNTNNKDKTELVLMVTPHILKENAVSYFDQTPTGKNSNMNQGQGGLQPVSLPQFIGPNASSNPPADQPLIQIHDSDPGQSIQPTIKSGKASSDDNPLLKTGQSLQAPQKIMVGPVVGSSQLSSLDALKATKPTVNMPVSKAERVYQKPTPKPQLLELMDEILKN